MSESHSAPALVPIDPPASNMVPIKLLVPIAWRTWLDEAAKVRGLSRAALVRQCIRGLMVARHDA